LYWQKKDEHANAQGKPPNLQHSRLVCVTINAANRKLRCLIQTGGSCSAKQQGKPHTALPTPVENIFIRQKPKCVFLALALHHLE
jgi:hypothetical protein